MIDYGDGANALAALAPREIGVLDTVLKDLDGLGDDALVEELSATMIGEEMVFDTDVADGIAYHVVHHKKRSTS